MSSSRITNQIQHLTFFLCSVACETKKHDMRIMVGYVPVCSISCIASHHHHSERYRELIDAADTIVHMAAASALVSFVFTVCSQITPQSTQAVSSVSEMQKQCTQLQNSVRNTSDDDDDPTRAPLYHTAMQMKLLVDTPEKVWAALESKELSKGAMLYLLARSTYTQLRMESEPSTTRLVASAPVIARQWSAISQFRDVRTYGACAW